MGHNLSVAVSAMAWVSGHAANAYNSVVRVFGLDEAEATSALLAEATAAMYGEPNYYVQQRDGQEAKVYLTSIGGFQGCPLFLQLYCLAQAPTVRWTQAAINAAQEARQLRKWSHECGSRGHVPPEGTWRELQGRSGSAGTAWRQRQLHRASFPNTTWMTV